MAALTLSQRKENTMRKGRKGTMMVALVALLVAIFAAAAYASDQFGGDGNNTLTDNDATANDLISGGRGNDTLSANAPNADNDADKLTGNRHRDYVSGVDGETDDFVAGNRGNGDTCVLDRDTTTDETDTQGGGCETVQYVTID